jgi:hypothetical protein
MSSVRIVHASDLHIAAVPLTTSLIDRITPGNVANTIRTGVWASSYNPLVLACFAKFVWKNRASLNAVMLTGDIATTGSQKDLDVAHSFVTSTADIKIPWLNDKREPTLEGSGVNVWIMPGNHDRYKHTLPPTFYLPGGTYFDKRFQNKWTYPVTTFSESVQDLTVAVITADLNLRDKSESKGSYGWLAQGKAYTDILDKLENETDEAKDKYNAENRALAVLWAIHFPPDYPYIANTNKLLDSDTLIYRANHCQINGILSGHTHQPVRYRTPKMKFDVFCTGSVSQHYCPEGNHFQIIEVSTLDGQNISINLEHYQYKKSQHRTIYTKSDFYKI